MRRPLLLLPFCLPRHVNAQHRNQQEVTNTPCTLCPDGGDFQRPNYAVNSIPGIPDGSTCLIINNILPSLFTLDSNECSQIHQLLSLLCGCEIEPPAEEGELCSICGSTESNNSPLQELERLENPKAIVRSASETLFQGVIPEPTCEMIQAYSLTNLSVNSTECGVAMDFQADCGTCKPLSTVGAEPNPDNPSVEEMCSLCHDGSSIQFPEKEVVVPGFPNMTCSTLNDLTSNLDATLPDCSLAKNFGFYCGCPRKPGTCEACQLGDSVEPLLFNNTLPRVAVEFGGISPTCEIYESILAHAVMDATAECSYAQLVTMEGCGCRPVVPKDEQCVMCPGGIEESVYDRPFAYDLNFRCGQVELLSQVLHKDTWSCYLSGQTMHKCGCNNGVWNYGGANTRAKQAALAWAPKATSLLSIGGSLFILRHIWRKHAKGSPTSMYHQIMIGMSTSDIISSCAWFISSWAIPKYDVDGVRLDIYGAAGNAATCKAQAFFLVLGTATVWYNVAISVYYKLVIVDGWHERAFTRKIRAILLCTPAFLSCTFAFAGLRFYSWLPMVCGLLSLPWEVHKKEFLALALIPYASAMFIATAMTFYIYYRFAKQMRASDKWRFNSRASAIRASSAASTLPASRSMDLRRSTIGASSEANENISRLGKIRRALAGFWLCGCFNYWKQRLFATTMEGQVLRQCVFYLMAFIGYAPFIFTSAFISGKFKIFNYNMNVLSMFLAPLQGFNNALIFFRPSVLAKVHRMRQRRLVVNMNRNSSNNNANDDSMNDSSRRARRRFLLGHFIGGGSSGGDPSDSNQPREDNNANQLDDDPDAFETVTVGSFRLPSQRGSALWEAASDMSFHDSLTKMNSSRRKSLQLDMSAKGLKVDDTAEDFTDSRPDFGASVNSLRIMYHSDMEEGDGEDSCESVTGDVERGLHDSIESVESPEVVSVEEIAGSADGDSKDTEERIDGHHDTEVSSKVEDVVGSADTAGSKDSRERIGGEQHATDEPLQAISVACGVGSTDVTVSVDSEERIGSEQHDTDETPQVTDVAERVDADTNDSQERFDVPEDILKSESSDHEGKANGPSNEEPHEKYSNESGNGDNDGSNMT